MLYNFNRQFNIAMDKMHYECDASAEACAKIGMEYAEGKHLTDNNILS